MENKHQNMLIGGAVGGFLGYMLWQRVQKQAAVDGEVDPVDPWVYAVAGAACGAAVMHQMYPTEARANSGLTYRNPESAQPYVLLTQNTPASAWKGRGVWVRAVDNDPYIIAQV